MIRTIIVVICLLTFFAHEAIAANIAFNFDGQITDITTPANGSFTLPLQAGDDVTGVIEFTPTSFGQTSAVQSLRLTIGSQVFSVSDTSLVTRDNTVVPNGIADIIEAGCSTGYTCLNGSSSIGAVAIEQLRLRLSSSDLSAAGIGEDVADANLWNRPKFFPPVNIGLSATREFWIEFKSDNVGVPGTVLVHGTLGLFAAVPEPSSLVSLLGMSDLFFRRTRWFS